MTDTRPSLYRRHRFPPEIIGEAVWLYFRFPLSFRMVEDMLAYKGIIVTHKTVREWAQEFGRAYANKIRRRTARPGDKCWGGRPPNGIAMCQSEVVADLRQRRPSVDQIIRIGMDTSKHVFQLHGVNAAEKPVLRKKLRRKEMVDVLRAARPDA